MARREFASEAALKKHAEVIGDFYAWEGTASFARWQSLLKRDQYEIVDVRTSQAVKRAMLFPKAILKPEWELDPPLREGLGINRPRRQKRGKRLPE
jgi:hypothetical protein